jgi:hypothetical protein
VLGGAAEPTFDGAVGQALALDRGGFAWLQLAQGRHVVGQVLLAAAWERALSFLRCQLAQRYRHRVPRVIAVS